MPKTSETNLEVTRNLSSVILSWKYNLQTNGEGRLKTTPQDEDRSVCPLSTRSWTFGSGRCIGNIWIGLDSHVRGRAVSPRCGLFVVVAVASTASQTLKDMSVDDDTILIFCVCERKRTPPAVNRLTTNVCVCPEWGENERSGDATPLKASCSVLSREERKWPLRTQ